MNLSCGVLGIIFAFKGGFDWVVFAAFLTFVASIFDFLDGFTARLFNQFSKFGKELDSLADMDFPDKIHLLYI